MLAKLAISQRILLGFMALLCISFFITSVNILNLSSVNNRFHQLNKISAETNVVLEIDKNVSELQRSILVFSKSEKNADISQMSERHKELLISIEKLIANNSFLDVHSQEALQQMRSSVQSFEEKIESLASQQTYREKLINIELSSLHQKMNATMSELFREADKTGNKNLLPELWRSQIYLSQTEILSTRYFTKHDIKIRRNVDSNINEAALTLKNAVSLTNNADMSNKINNIVQWLASVKTTFNKAVQADRDYLFLANVVIAGESGELSTLAEQLKNESIASQEKLIKENNKEINHNQLTVIYLSLMGAVLAVIMAIVIGRRISKPLQLITHTFNQLTKNETVSDIPGADRQDEIGQLAKAANVFRETNARTKELLAQAEQSAEILMQREQALEIAAIKAKEASVAKSHFLANMSHEIRTPMNAILGMLALLRKTELTERQADYAIKTEGAARSLLSLLNDILDISKAEAGKIELDPIPFSLDQMAQDILVILSANLTNKPVELRFNIADDVPRYLLADSFRLQQIIINLGSNAIKFTERGTVDINITQDYSSDTHTYLHVSVKDSGIGIAPENQAKIFSGFTQAESSTTRRFGGTGLGLAISQHLVSLMGGTLSLTSQLGEGSCFYFSISLPLLSEEEIAALKQDVAKKSHQHTEKRLEHLRILLVEDNVNNQQIAVELLEAEGALLQVANHGEEALTILSGNLHTQHSAGFDLILMDLQMPVMDGLTATHAIRTQLGLSSLPIVAMTSNAMASDREVCINAGMNEHVGKPFDLHHLVAVVRRQVGWANATPPTPSETKIEVQLSATDIAMQYKIDLKTALQRLGGKQEFYIRMIPMFLKSLNDVPTDLETLYNKGDLRGASRTLHSLKGLAATMGVTELSAKAAIGEKLLINEAASVDEKRAFLDELFVEIRPVITAMKALEHAMQ